MIIIIIMVAAAAAADMDTVAMVALQQFHLNCLVELLEAAVRMAAALIIMEVAVIQEAVA